MFQLGGSFIAEEGKPSPGLIISQKNQKNLEKKGKTKLVIFTIMEGYQWVHLGVAGIWTVAYVCVWRRKKGDQAKSRVCGCLLRIAKSKADCEDFAEDSQKAESPGIKTAIKLNVSKYPVTPREKCDS